MAAKKKGGKGAKGKKKDKSSEPDEGPVTVEDLQQQIEDLKEEIGKEENERNYFQLERDRMQTYWDITRKQLEDSQADIRLKEKEMQDLEERHIREVKVYKQKVKHLLYEHKNNMNALKNEGEVSEEAMDETHGERMGLLKKDKRNLKLELKELELSHEDIVKNAKNEHEKNMSKLRTEFERMYKDLEVRYNKRIQNLEADLQLRRKMELHEIEERKNLHINELMIKHEKAFMEIKKYYNDITHNNLELIKSLKTELAEMRKKEASNEKLMYEIASENKRLSEPLTKALKQVEEYRHKLMNYNKDKLSLQGERARCSVTESRLASLQWEHEQLQESLRSVIDERDELYSQFESTVQEVSHRSAYRNVLLERKLSALGSALERKELQLGEVLKAAKLEPTQLASITHGLENVLEAKNSAIRDLTYELARVTKAHDDVVRTYEARLVEMGIPAEELGLTLVGHDTGAGPAGLVVG